MYIGFRKTPRMIQTLALSVTNHMTQRKSCTTTSAFTNLNIAFVKFVTKHLIEKNI